MQKHSKINFEQILEENKGSIYRICKIYAVNPIEPQDLFQEVVYQLWKALPTFKGKSKINTWIYSIALNVCGRANTRFGKKNSKTTQLEAIEFIPKADNIAPEEELKITALRACIALLKEEERSIVILSLEGLKYKEIGEITGLTENHIAVKMKRIKKILLRCITQKIK